MACDISMGRNEECKDNVGGIRAIYFINYGDMDGVILGADDEVTDFGATAVNAYKYELKATTNTLEQTIVSSRDNGTTYFDQNLNITLKKMTKEMNKEVKLLAAGRPHVVVEDYNGNSWLAGKNEGVDANGGSVVTGGAIGDLNGYTLTFLGQEGSPANFMEGGVLDNPFAGLSSSVVTIVEGTN